MSKLIWNYTGQNRYEAGLDRGVLYLAGFQGVAWNGLVNVDASSSGGDITSFYYDGRNYNNVATPETFKGSIEAFTYPSIFSLCDGSKQLVPGLYATQQRRVNFGICFRTQIGDDLNGPDAGYKLHIIWNALATPSAKAYSTKSETTDPYNFKWDMSAFAPRAATFKPTPYLIINSREVDAETLAALEDTLYGSDTKAPMLPSQAEVLKLLTYGPGDPPPDDQEIDVLDGGSASYTTDGEVDGGPATLADPNVIEGGTAMPTASQAPPVGSWSPTPGTEGDPAGDTGIVDGVLDGGSPASADTYN